MKKVFFSFGLFVGALSVSLLILNSPPNDQKIKKDPTSIVGSNTL